MEMTETRVKEIFQEDFIKLMETNKEFFFKLFYDFFIEMLEDKGMLAALAEIEEEDNEEADEVELEAIFNGEFITQK